MSKIYKYLIAWIGETKDGNTQYGNTFIEYGVPLDTQSQIEQVRKDINRAANLLDCSILYIKRVKVERLESGKNE